MQPFKQTTNPELLTHHNTDQCEHISQWAVTALPAVSELQLFQDPSQSDIFPVPVTY